MMYCPDWLAGLVNNSICEEEVFAHAACDYDGYDCCHKHPGNTGLLFKRITLLVIKKLSNINSWSEIDIKI